MKDEQFFKDGLFDWQISHQSYENLLKQRCYDEEKYWGGFSKDLKAEETLPKWAIGPFEKYQNNPVFVPNEKTWDSGHISGGVHNGSILFRNNQFYYIYRGEKKAPLVNAEKVSGDIEVVFDYICDIGIAISPDGINFERTKNSPLFRNGGDEKYSFEDVNCVEWEGTYYLFCNRWNWKDPVNPKECGVFLATSKDLINWEKHGLVFKDADRIHRNACVVQNNENHAVKINNRFVMYLNDQLMAYSDDLINWQSEEISTQWPGGEGCFALADYSDEYPDNIILFTGGHHTGHFYAIGEVLFSKNKPHMPLKWLNRPILTSDENIPYENGYSYKNPKKRVSLWRDTVFFTGMTLYKGEWYCYYGGSEYYTCLAKAKKSYKY